MSQQLAECLQSVEVASPLGGEGFQVFGLHWTPSEAVNYMTLDDSLARGLLEVTELSDGGSVPTLKVRNQGDTLVFLMAGEHLVGAKQNRVLNASLLVPANSELPIPVSCVEAGRWAYRSRSFGSSGSSSHGRLRRMMSDHVTKSYHSRGTPTSDQSEVWTEVNRKLETMGSHSDSSDLHQAYTDHSSKLDGVLQELHVPEEASGAVFVIGGRIAGVDLFDRPATLAKLWPKLVRAYALDAFEEPDSTREPLSSGDVKAWLQSTREARAEAFKSPGVGDDVRLEGATLIGAGLLVDSQPIHVELFPSLTA